MVNTCEDKKRGQIDPVLKSYLEKSVLAWCEKEAYSVTGMKNNLR